MQYVEVVRVYHRADDDDDGVVADEAWLKIMKKSWLIHFCVFFLS